MADLYLTPAERYTAALGGFYYGNLPEPGTVYTQLIKDILDGTTPDKEPKNILARFIYSLYISDLSDPYPRYELAKLLYWKLHNITPTKSGSILIVTIDGKEDYMTINTDLSRLWYKVLFGSKTDVITEFPYIFNTMQNKLSDWELFGNTSVSGTPTPDNPIMPQGTGERTGNLLDFYALQNAPSGMIGSSACNHVLELVLEANTTYTCISNGSGSTSGSADDNRSIYFNNSDATNVVYSGHSVTVTTGADGKVKIGFFSSRANAQQYINGSAQAWLVKGSVPLSYEPYGYKIPISSANTTTPVYLGEVETTRKIKKYVFTGQETIAGSAVTGGWIITNLSDSINNTSGMQTAYCSHYLAKVNSALSELSNGEMCISTQYNNRINFVTTFQTSTEFGNYLSQQYAAGTPVTVWYVLANEETAVVNEPLMKIGEYADSMSRTQTGIDIPTVIGQNTLDVLTTVKPSSMSIEYTSAEENQSRSKRISLLKSPLKKGLIK